MDNNNISTQKDESHLVKNDCDEYRFRRYLSQVIIKYEKRKEINLKRNLTIATNFVSVFLLVDGV